MKLSPISAPSALAGSLAFALAAALPAPAGAQSGKAELTIDVATHTSPGMGGGLMGRLASRTVAKPHYGMARHPGMAGRYLDVALYNPARPGVPAQQAIPKGLRLGKQLELLPPERKGQANDAGGDATSMAFSDGGTYRVRYYWGCGEHAGKGQPVEYSVTVRNGKPVQKGRAMKPRFTPDHIDVDRGYVLWPNQASRDAVSSRASLVGGHHVTGEKLPDAMQFELAAAQDFMAELEPTTTGNTTDGLTLKWNGVDGAQAYFAHATVADGDTLTEVSDLQREQKKADSDVEQVRQRVVHRLVRLRRPALPRGAFGDRRADARDVEFTRLYAAECDRMRRLAYLMTGQPAVAEEIVVAVNARVRPTPTTPMRRQSLAAVVA